MTQDTKDSYMIKRWSIFCFTPFKVLNGQHRSTRMLGARNSIHVSRVNGKDTSTWAIFCFQGTLARSSQI